MKIRGIAKKKKKKKMQEIKCITNAIQLTKMKLGKEVQSDKIVNILWKL